MSDIVTKILNYYQQLLNYFPEPYRPLVSAAIIVVLLVSIIKFLQKNFIWLILVLLLFPAAWPALKTLGQSLYQTVIHEQNLPKP